MQRTDFEPRFDGTTAAFLAKIAELCPRHLTQRDMERLTREGHLRTLMSVLPNHRALDEVMQVINGEATVKKHKSFRVSSNGRTGQEWLDFFEGKVSAKAKEVLLSADFEPTNGVCYNLRLAPGKLVNHGGRSPSGVRFGSNQQEPLDTSLELACLIREQVTADDFKKLGCGDRGLIAMHVRIPEEQYDAFPRWGHWLIAKWSDDLCLSAHKVSHGNSLMGGAGYIFCTSVQT